MGKYTSRSSAPKEVDKSPHAVWRGIGCLMFIIIPVISIAGAIEAVNYGVANRWPIPYELLGYPTIPDLIRKIDIFWALARPIAGILNFNAYVAFSLGFITIIGGFSSVLYAFIYRFVGPARYGQYDVPPPKIKTKKYTR